MCFGDTKYLPIIRLKLHKSKITAFASYCYTYMSLWIVYIMQKKKEQKMMEKSEAIRLLFRGK